jgi:tricorn protease
MVLSALVLCLAAQSPASPPPEMRLMRYPTVHGNEVAFTYASDIWVTNLSGGYARRITSHPGLEQKAYYSADGSMLAFTAQYDGNPDVYVMPSEGGEPKRLTFEPGGSVCQGWTPEGKIAYLSSYGSPQARQRRLWLVDPKGGIPQSTAIQEAADVWFSPDGHKVVYDRQGSNRFNWRRYRGGSQGVISIFDLQNNSYKELPHGRENSWNPMWIGDSIYYVSDKNEKTVNLYRYDVGSGSTTELTHYTDSDIHWPNTDGKTIVFERDGYLFRFDIASGQATKINPEVRGDLLATRPQLRKLAGAISAIALSPSGVRVAAEARGHIFSIPAKHGTTRDYTINSKGSRARFPDWSPDGKNVAYVSDASGEYQIYTVPQMGGDPTQVTEYKGPSIEGINWSPDNKHIAFTTAGLDLNLVDTSSKQVTTVYADTYAGIGNYDFSPDGKWIAFIASGKNLFSALYLYNVDTAKLTQVDDGFYNDQSVSFDLSGKYLYLVSDRTYRTRGTPFEDNLTLGDTARIYVMTLTKDTKDPLNADDDEEGGQSGQPLQQARRHPGGPPPGAAPAGGETPPGGAQAPAQPSQTPPPPPPMRIDLDGLAGRMIPLPMPAGAYGGVIGSTNGVIYGSRTGLVRYDMAAKVSAPILVGPIGAIAFNPSRTKLAYAGPTGIGIVDVRPGPPSTVGEGAVDTSAVEAVIDPRAEWKQIYWEAWRYERDHFYDKQFLGLNWDAIGKHYASYLPYVSHRDDLNYVLGLLIGEFGTSHAYVSGGDMGAAVTAIPIGQLGADYSVDSGKVRFKKIYPGEQYDEDARGPLGEPGVNVSEGDYLLAIDGQPVDEHNSPDSRLVDKAGKEVTLTVNSTPSMEGSRTVVVRPVGSEAMLRYESWQDDRRAYVAQRSGGRIGYMHVPDTSDPGMTEFLKGYYSQNDKDALIVDERWNAGGHIPTFFTEKLARTSRAILKPRWGGDVGFPNQAVEGPKAMLINGYSGSGGDLFPWLFRQAKLGPLIGERTWGGLVGINGNAPLVDGGGVTAPAFGMYDPATGAWIAENNGISPDIEVDARPDLVAQGKDPQLDAAIDYLMKELEKEGPVSRKQPVYPKVIPPPPAQPAGGGRR